MRDALKLVWILSLLCCLSLPAVAVTHWDSIKNGFVKDLDRQLKSPEQRRELFPQISLHTSVKTRLQITVTAATWKDTLEQRQYMIQALRSLWVRHCGPHSPNRLLCTIQVYDPQRRFVGGSDEKGRLSVR